MYGPLVNIYCYTYDFITGFSQFKFHNGGRHRLWNPNPVVSEHCTLLVHFHSRVTCNSSDSTVVVPAKPLFHELDELGLPRLPLGVGGRLGPGREPRRVGPEILEVEVAVRQHRDVVGKEEKVGLDGARGLLDISL